jgi:hypothetical protein
MASSFEGLYPVNDKTRKKFTIGLILAQKSGRKEEMFPARWESP